MTLFIMSLGHKNCGIQSAYSIEVWNPVEGLRMGEREKGVIFHEHSPTCFSHPFIQARRAELVR